MPASTRQVRSAGSYSSSRVIRSAEKATSGRRARKELAGVRAAVGIENAADPIHHFEVVIREDIADVLTFFQTDPMFAGHRSAGIGTELQDLVADPKHGFVLTRFERIEENERVKVAVAGVEHVADLETGALADGVDLRERLGPPRGGPQSLDHINVRRQATHRREGSLAPLPEPLAFRLVASDPHLTGAVLAADPRHPLAEVLGNLRGAVNFEQ